MIQHSGVTENLNNELNASFMGAIKDGSCIFQMGGRG